MSYVALKWCMTSITLIYQQTVPSQLFSGSGFRLKLQSVVMMASSRKGLLEDQIEQSLLEELTASDQSSCSDDDDSSGTECLTVGEVRNVAIMKVTMCNVLVHSVRLVLRVLHLRGRTWRIM